jgi:hypothetical protein
VTALLAVLMAAIVAVVAGCGAGGRVEQLSLEADPAFVVRVLPTRPGLDIAGAGTTGDAALLATGALGRSVPALEKSAREAGVQKVAVREWTGPDGARLVAVAALWDDGEAAGAIGGEIARAAVPGGRAWTPTQFGGSQGSRSDDARALSVVIGKVSLFVRAEGPVDDEAVLRTIDLMRKAAAKDDLRGAGGG